MQRSTTSNIGLSTKDRSYSEMKVMANFDGGNIAVVRADNPEDIRLEIRPDTQSEFKQWFFFRVVGTQGFVSKITIANAGQASYPQGWEGYRAVASYDLRDWFRVPTSYRDGALEIKHQAECNSVYYAYFAPYPHWRHQELVHKAQANRRVIVESLGQTVEGHNIDLLIAGEVDDAKPRVWIIARQHPGETMAEWFMEGLIERLINPDDPVAKRVLDKVALFLVPNVNIDGSIRGNLRANAAGRNLNRAWADPDPEASPEVFHITRKMMDTGVNMCLDIHGDEGLPYVFATSNCGIPSFTPQLAELEREFGEAWSRVNPDFQTTHGYPRDKAGEANLEVCSKWVGETFDCLSLTIEMPFKDNNNLPDTQHGWSPKRSKILGASLLNVILEMADKIM